MEVSHNLERFINAQEGIYETVISELRRGCKESHWMWYIFPQIRGLGSSPMSVEYSIGSLQEAKEYLNHRILGMRIRECTQLVLNIDDYSAGQIFGSIDELKFRSSMTLFNCAQENEIIFELALAKYFKSSPDNRTLELISYLTGG